MGDARSQVGDGVGQIRKIEHFMVLRGLFPSSLIENIGKWYHLLLWGTEGEPLGDRWVMRNPRRVRG